MTVYVRTQRKERRRNEETRMEEGGCMYSGAVVIFCLLRAALCDEAGDIHTENPGCGHQGDQQ